MHIVSTNVKVFCFLHKGNLGSTKILSATSETIITFLAFYLYVHFHAIFNCWYTLHALYNYFFLEQSAEVSQIIQCKKLKISMAKKYFRSLNFLNFHLNPCCAFDIKKLRYQNNMNWHNFHRNLVS